MSILSVEIVVSTKFLPFTCSGTTTPPDSLLALVYNCAFLTSNSDCIEAMLFAKDVNDVEGSEASSATEKEGTLIPESFIGGSTNAISIQIVKIGY